MHLISRWERCFFVPETRKEYQMNKAIIIGRLNKSGVNFNDNFEKDGEIMDQISNLVPHR